MNYFELLHMEMLENKTYLTNKHFKSQAGMDKFLTDVQPYVQEKIFRITIVGNLHLTVTQGTEFNNTDLSQTIRATINWKGISTSNKQRKICTVNAREHTLSLLELNYPDEFSIERWDSTDKKANASYRSIINKANNHPLHPIRRKHTAI